MKKLFLILLIYITDIFQSIAQSINSDSLLQVIINNDIIGKVEKHEKIVQRIEWTSPSLLTPTIAAILALLYSVYLHVRGLHNKAEAILKSEEFKIQLDKTVNERVVAISKSQEERIKAKPICVVYTPGKDMRRLPKFLEHCGFTNVTVYTTKDDTNIKPNTVVIFNDEDGSFTDKIGDYIRNNSDVQSKGHFFYFGSKRFNDEEIRMKNFANSDDTLAARLFESLTVA